MKRIYLVVLLIVTACYKKDAPFDAFVFSVGSYTKDFSLKIDNSDTIYYQDRFKMKTGRNYYAVPNKADRDSIIAIIEHLNFPNYDSIYIQENLMDGAGIKFYKKKGTVEDWIFFYGDAGPRELNEYADKFYILMKRMSFKPYPKKVDLGDLKYVQIPEITFIPLKNPTP
ncbi:hypothetical protein HYN59_17195 [Flavobacterium album]|uniref:Uncharacterized protein n=1 Tax=Flavobacterium album TaxID=2175091 RepID=A0A2S1R2C3_9FLAO|nr:hypothetical protein [Flavobacterium album]AWH86736.1 hypothetical protein HYN59_17195 [Flavobacterium album]